MPGDATTPTPPLPQPTLYQPRPFEALVQDLVWPMLFRAPRMSLRPARVGLGAGAILLSGLLWQLPGLWLRSPRGGGVFEAIANAAPTVLAGWVEAASSLSVFGWLVLVASAVIQSIAGGSIARSVATEFALRRRLSWPEALGFGLRRAGSLATLVLLPAAALGVAYGFITLYGWVMLSLPVVQVAGGALYILPLAAGVAASLLLAGLALGVCMLAPSLACEGIDAIDSLQRTFAYVAARPLTLLAKLILVGVLGGVTLGLAGGIARLATDATHAAATSTTAAITGLADEGAKSTWSKSSARALIRTWSNLPGLLVAGLCVSYFFTGGTLLYLSMRHACDGQDPEELWPDAPPTAPQTTAPTTPPGTAPSPPREDSVP